MSGRRALLDLPEKLPPPRVLAAALLSLHFMEVKAQK